MKARDLGMGKNETFDDIFCNIVFVVTMARDVSKYIKEEKEKERLCLSLQ